MSWLRRAFFLLFLPVLVLSACGSSRQDPPPRAAPPPSNGPTPSGGAGCGVTVSSSPACESVLDSMCCPQQQACARDQNCVRFMQCRDNCKAVSARGGQGDSCIAGCVPPGAGPAGIQAWFAITSCSANIHYPQGYRCDEPF